MKPQIKEHQAFNPSVLYNTGLEELNTRQVAKIDIAADNRNTQEFENWKKQRLGKITGSLFHKVSKLKIGRAGRVKGDWSGTAMTLLYGIISEHITGEPKIDFTSKATNWGIENEPLAIDFYKKKQGVTVTPVGFKQITNYIGCTVDGEVVTKKEHGVIEVKCPFNSANHIRVIAENAIPDEYYEQVLGHLLVTGAAWCDFISFDPRAKLDSRKMHIIRVNRSDIYRDIDNLKDTLLEFEKMLIEKLTELKII